MKFFCIDATHVDATVNDTCTNTSLRGRKVIIPKWDLQPTFEDMDTVLVLAAGFAYRLKLSAVDHLPKNISTQS